MNDWGAIKDVPFGTEVYVGMKDGYFMHDICQSLVLKNVHVIGRLDTGETCVAWNSRESYPAAYDKRFFDSWESSRYAFMADWKHQFEYVYWLHPDTRVRSVEKPVLHKDQCCSACGRPAPHAPPNKRGVYICDVCAMRAIL